jgi:hypothetical protein
MKYLLIMIASAVILLISCSSEEQGDRKLAEDCARLMFPYDTFTTLYQDLRVEGQPASREHYEQMIRIRINELYDSFTVEELKKIYAFYESPLGQRLLQHGLESKSYQPLLTQKGTGPNTVWSCTIHSEIRTPKAGLCPICRRELIPVILDKKN